MNVGDDPIGRLLLGGAGRLRAVEIEFEDRAAFGRAARLLDPGAMLTPTTHVVSGEAGDVEVVLILIDQPASYLSGR